MCTASAKIVDPGRTGELFFLHRIAVRNTHGTDRKSITLINLALNSVDQSSGEQGHDTLPYGLGKIAPAWIG